MNNNIWEILQIVPTRDEKEIKTAFAKRSKDCHPEEHPEAFLELKNAYQEALAFAKEREETAKVPTVAVSESDSIGKDASLVDAYYEASATSLTTEEQKVLERSLHQLRIILMEEKYRNNLTLWKQGYLSYLKQFLAQARKDEYRAKPIGAEIATAILDLLVQAPPLPVKVYDVIESAFAENGAHLPEMREPFMRLERMRAQAAGEAVPLWSGKLTDAETIKIFENDSYARYIRGRKSSNIALLCVTVFCILIFAVNVRISESKAKRAGQYRYHAAGLVVSEVEHMEEDYETGRLTDYSKDGWNAYMIPYYFERLKAVKMESTFQTNEGYSYYVWYDEAEDVVIVSREDAVRFYYRNIPYDGDLADWSVVSFLASQDDDLYWTYSDFIKKHEAEAKIIQDIEELLGYDYSNYSG